MNLLLNYRWLEPFTLLLRQGLSPENISLTIASGIVLGVAPVLGSTVALCTPAAILLHLDLPAIQLVNGVVYPLQLLLLIPLYKLGAWIFGANAGAVSLHGIAEVIHTGFWHALPVLWVVTLHALIAWLATSVITATTVYLVDCPIQARDMWEGP